MGFEWEALDALSHQFELCKIDASTRVVILFDRSAESDRIELIRAAISRTRAEALEIAPTHSDPAVLDRLSSQHLLPAIVDEADVIVTCITGRHGALDDVLERSPAQVVRIATTGAAPQDYPPHISLRRRVDALEAALRSGTAMHVTDRHGTDMHLQLPRSGVTADHGLIGDHVDDAEFPSGWVDVTPAAAAVHGDLVLMPGDANVNASRLISSPLRLQILDDHISAIKGENPDADMLRAQLEYPGAANAYGAANLSIGMNPSNRALTTFDDRLVDPSLCRLLAGVVTVGFGGNLVADRPCDQLITLALPGRTVRVDGLPVMTAGVLEGDFAPDVYEL